MRVNSRFVDKDTVKKHTVNAENCRKVFEMDTCKIEACGESECGQIHQRLREYNSRYLWDAEGFGFCCRDQKGELVAGIVATREHQCMNVDFLWVDERCRGRGLGKQLLERVESLAREKQCRLVCLNTYSFQAPGFYEKMGYEVFGVLERCLDEHTQYFFKKMLDRPG